MQRFGISRVATDNHAAKRALSLLCVASPGAALAAGLIVLSACAGPGGGAGAGAVVVSEAPPTIAVDAGARARFEPVATPLTPEEQRSLQPSLPTYVPLLRDGEVVGRGRFGQLYDRRGAPIPDPGRPGYPRVCAGNDFNGLLEAHGSLFLVSHFECQPGAVYLTGLNQDASNHHLAPLWTQPVDFSAVGGGSLLRRGHHPLGHPPRQRGVRAGRQRARGRRRHAALPRGGSGQPLRLRLAA